MYTVVYQVFRKETMSREEFARYWTEKHSTYASSVPGIVTNVAYVVHSESAGTEDTPDGFAVLTYESRETFDASLSSPEMATSSKDAANFISRSVMFHVDTHRVL